MNWSEVKNPDEWKFTTPIPDLKQWKQVDKNSKILDVGCGYGRTLEYLSKNGYTNLYGIDVSPRFIKQAQQLCPTAHLCIGDCMQIDSYFTNKFDVILVMGVMEYILEDQQQMKFLKKIKEMLSPHGMAIFEVFTMDWKNNWKQYLLGSCKKWHWGVFVNSKGFMCHHQTCARLRRTFNSLFPFVLYEKKVYSSWTNNQINGLNIIASNNELQPI